MFYNFSYLMKYFAPLFLLLTLLLIGCMQAAIPDEVVPTLVVEEVPDDAAETLAALLAAEPPQRDLVELAQRLKGIDVSAELPPKLNSVGDTEMFWYLQGGQTNTRISAELAYQSDMINMWIEEGARYSEKDLLASASVLEQDIVPTNRTFFGDEPRPGIDGDDRINFLHLKDLGGASAGSVIAGYFSAADRAPAAANQFSNEREILYINLSAAPFASVDYYQVIAHELEHLIQSQTDTNEGSWVDEGLAELAAYVNGYEDVDSVNQYVELPDVQLNDWSQGTHEDLPHYGASFLFSAYFLDRFGEDATRSVVSASENGFAGYEHALNELGSDMTTDALFADWAVTNYLAGIGRTPAPWRYNSVTLPKPAVFANHDSFPVENNGAVYQYGVDYIEIESEQAVDFEFIGSQQVDLMPATPHSGRYFFSTYPADRSDMQLTREFDLTATEVETITLNFWSWYQIEEGWDYGYVTVSADQGETWQMLGNKVDFTEANPHGNNYGLALTGESGFEDEPVWRELFVDLTPYRGEQILLRFEYITDEAVFEAGWAIDDITIDAIGYAEDFENGNGDWEAAGWIRHANTLAQTYLLRAIYLSDDDVRVEPLTLDAEQTGTFNLSLDSDFDQVIITISGNTPVTKQRVAYTYNVAP